MDSNIYLIAKEYAIECHDSTNHKYDKVLNYSHHLYMVNDVALSYGYLIPNSDFSIVLAACWCHDVIEDCRQTYNDVKQATNEQVAELVYAVTNEKGKNRAERANDKYYEGIRTTKYATFVKLCDRIANIQHSKKTASSMLGKYQKENAHFRAQLYDEEYKALFAYMDLLLADY